MQYFRPLPVTAATPTITPVETVGRPPVLPWPATGQAALAVDGIGAVGHSGPGTPAPMASTAKIMTALLTLEDHPLAPNESGPVIVVARADVATYVAERNQNESVVPVVAGEQLTEYQLLQGLLLPSGSNFAAMLAGWDAGSVPAFIDRMNQRAAALGMTATKYADVSGFDPATVSTAGDLVKIAQAAMRIPVFAQIVAQPQTTLPVAGVIHNLDTLLGQNGVIGIKTGHTDQAGGCFVFAADYIIDGQAVRVYGAVMGQPNFLAGAFSATTSLLSALRPALHVRVVLARSEVVGHYTTPWGESGSLIAGRSVRWLLLDGTAITRQAQLSSLPSMLDAGSAAGTLRITAGTQQAAIPVITASAIQGPDLGWRLTRGL